MDAAIRGRERMQKDFVAIGKAEVSHDVERRIRLDIIGIADKAIGSTAAHERIGPAAASQPIVTEAAE